MKFHQPVLLDEVIRFLNIDSQRKYLDATVGGGGHSEAILKAGGQVLGIDWDPAAVEFAKEHLSLVCPRASWQVVQANFSRLKEIAERHGFRQVSGVIFDLGVSSHQLDTVERGFSWQKEAPLDMRMDPSLAVTAADLLKILSKKQLNELFTRFVQEKRARAIAEALDRSRSLKPITTTKQLAGLVQGVYGERRKIRHIHPATKIFLALRLAVNSELANLEQALPQAVELLAPGGRLLVISFHQTEDRIVKQFFKENKELKILTKKPVTASPEEVVANPRARSARLRVATRKAPAERGATG